MKNECNTLYFLINDVIACHLWDTLVLAVTPVVIASNIINGYHSSQGMLTTQRAVHLPLPYHTSLPQLSMLRGLSHTWPSLSLHLRRRRLVFQQEIDSGLSQRVSCSSNRLWRRWNSGHNASTLVTQERCNYPDTCESPNVASDPPGFGLILKISASQRPKGIISAFSSTGAIFSYPGS